jgi:hypothetical protein
MDGTKALCLAAGMMFSVALPASARAQGTDDRGVAEGIVKQLEQDAAHKVVLADTIRNAKEALERAKRMHAAGDEGHARDAEGLAREWAETGRDLAKAAQAEATAADLRQKALDIQAKLERERALVEEGIARIGRLTAELSHAQEPARQAVEVHDGDPPKEPGKKAETKKKPAKAGTAGVTP